MSVQFFLPYHSQLIHSETIMKMGTFELFFSCFVRSFEVWLKLQLGLKWPGCWFFDIRHGFATHYLCFMVVRALRELVLLGNIPRIRSLPTTWPIQLSYFTRCSFSNYFDYLYARFVYDQLHNWSSLQERKVSWALGPSNM